MHRVVQKLSSPVFQSFEYTHTHTQKHTHIHTYTHTRIHAHTHTHTQDRKSANKATRKLLACPEKDMSLQF